MRRARLEEEIKLYEQLRFLEQERQRAAQAQQAQQAQQRSQGVPPQAHQQPRQQAQQNSGHNWWQRAAGFQFPGDPKSQFQPFQTKFGTSTYSNSGASVSLSEKQFFYPQLTR